MGQIRVGTASWTDKTLIAEGAELTHVLFNNCYRDYAQVNARELAERLGG